MSTPKKTVSSFLTTMGLLTRIPLPFRYTPDFTLFPFFFPGAGILFTVLMVLIHTGAAAVINTPAVLAALVLLIQYLLFNLFHFDGLLDSADALLYRTDKETRLKILKDKSSGSFAVFTGTLYIITKFTLLKEMIPSAHGLQESALLFLYIFAGRSAGALVPALSGPARDSGLGFLLKNYSRIKLAAGLLLSLGFIIVFFFFTSAAVFTAVAGGGLNILQVSGAALSTALLTGVFSAAAFNKGAGGYTGDAIGLAVELGELAYLSVLAVLPGVM